MLELFVYSFKISVFIIWKYTVAFFRQPQRGHQISFPRAVRHLVFPEMWIQALPKSSQCSSPLSHLSSPKTLFCVINMLSTDTKNSEEAGSEEKWVHFGKSEWKFLGAVGSPPWRWFHWWPIGMRVMAWSLELQHSLNDLESSRHSCHSASVAWRNILSKATEWGKGLFELK